MHCVVSLAEASAVQYVICCECFVPPAVGVLLPGLAPRLWAYPVSQVFDTSSCVCVREF
jgi:hypothetical protein